jgi:hypothetical protein
VNVVDDEQDLAPFAVMEAAELGGWAVVNTETLHVVEPGLLWRRREAAVAWARAELARLRREADDYQRAQDEVVERALAQSWEARRAEFERR